MSYAPTPASQAFTATTGAAASASAPVPRFADTGTAKVVANINACRTVLLFPFVTSMVGFETGIGISNTSSDPFGTASQSGTCSITFYGVNAGSAFTTPSVSPSTPFANNMSGMGQPNMQGYAFAVCNFLYAHGYASILANFGQSTGVFSSYLALVVPDPQTTTLGRPASTGTATTSSEVLAH